MKLDRKRSLSIEPAAIERYLRGTGWSVEDESSARVTVWAKKRDARRRLEVLVPRSSAYTDYPVRLAELLATLQEIERRPQEEILRDLRSASGAVVTLRAITETPDEIDIPLLDGIALASTGLQLVAAAARSAANQLVQEGTWRARLVSAYVAEIRLAPSETGSYALPLLLPDDVPYNTHVADETAVFGQRVKQELEIILDQVQVHSSQDRVGGQPEYWGPEEAAFWNALAGLSDAQELWSLSVELDPTADARGTLTPRRVFVFDNASLRRMREGAPYQAESPAAHRGAARQAMERPAETHRYGVELVGQVMRLERPAVMVRTELDGRPRSVRVLLPSEDDYECAIEAHRRRARVACTGELVLRGGAARLENVYVFDMLD